MTPKEKAIDLVNKYKPYTFGWKQTMSDNYAKECAKMLVAEIIEWVDWQQQEMKSYWVDVNNELKKL